MPGYDEQYKVIGHNLRNALFLELFVEFSFIVAFFAMLGAFSGGSPVSTPLFAKIYIVVAFLVTIVVIIRTRQMQAAVERHEMAALQRLKVGRWAKIAFLFSAMLPAIYLLEAAAAIPPN